VAVLLLRLGPFSVLLAVLLQSFYGDNTWDFPFDANFLKVPLKTKSFFDLRQCVIIILWFIIRSKYKTNFFFINLINLFDFIIYFFFVILIFFLSFRLRLISTCHFLFNRYTNSWVVALFFLLYIKFFFSGFLKVKIAITTSYYFLSYWLTQILSMTSCLRFFSFFFYRRFFSTVQFLKVVYNCLYCPSFSCIWIS